MKTIISADIGTSAAKIALVELQTGRILSSESRAYPLYTEGGYVEQDSEDWWNAFKSGVRSLVSAVRANPPEALVLSGQMQDLICIRGEAVQGRAILYSDTRAREEWSRISRDLDQQKLQDISANLGDAASLSSKLLWLRNHDYKSYEKNSFFLMGAHDYICWKLTGERVTDYTNASTTGLMNFSRNCWDSMILDYLGLDEEKLPRLAAAAEIVGELGGRRAGELGLPPGLPVIHGAGDAGSSTLGAGAGEEGRISCYLGTSGWMATTGKSRVDPELGIFNLRHPDPGKIINIGPMLCTGGNVDWIIRSALPAGSEGPSDKDFLELAEEAASVRPGAGGLFYLPYLMGERSPFRDPDARGAFIGLSRDSGRAQMRRAVLEGISYSLKSILDIMVPEEGRERSIYLSGGGADNPTLAGILSSICNSGVSVVDNAGETGVLGNVLIAARALGYAGNYEAPDHFLNMREKYEGDSNAGDYYQKGYAVFKTLYPSLKDSFKNIGRLEST